ncbi:LacI family DNA-binding transcriptional regulator [Microbacterium gorillae]|uniref:LacI family DNA-binding transcriptional regulator n=1 Tax=Microbacterium gorillae TaxID=1231063 RepID=UPI00058D7890|nr:LacI family DNA-binding transcriptional regulator [Microbacterium gorillae]
MRAAPEKVTVYTVAKRAGVSISTVSLALNAPHRVSEATRQRVVDAATALGYRSGRGGRSPESGALRIAVAAPFTSYSSYYRRLSGMLAVEATANVELLAHDLDSAASATSPLLDALPARPGVDGLIVMGVPPGGAALRAARQARMPMVLVDVRRESAALDDLPTVLVDDERGGRLIGEHLRDRGHRRAVFVHERQLSRDYLSSGMLRVRGLRGGLELVDLPITPGEDFDDRLVATVRADRAVTAVVANHDLLAAGVWRALTHAGMSVPDDVALVGYDDGDLAATLDLTTVRQPFEQSGRTALDVLLSVIAGRDSHISRIELLPELVVRSTT